MNVLRFLLFPCIAMFTLIFLFVLYNHLKAECEPINMNEFSTCVESCTTKEDLTKFDNERKLKEYCVERCVAMLRKCAYE